MKDGDGNLPSATRCCGQKITALAEFTNSVFGAGDGRNGPVDFAQTRVEVLVYSGDQLFAIGGGRHVLASDEMPNDLAFGSPSPFTDLGWSDRDPAIRQSAPQRFGDVPAVLDDGSADVKNDQPDGRRILGALRRSRRLSRGGLQSRRRQSFQGGSPGKFQCILRVEGDGYFS